MTAFSQDLLFSSPTTLRSTYCFLEATVADSQQAGEMKLQPEGWGFRDSLNHNGFQCPVESCDAWPRWLNYTYQWWARRTSLL